MYTTNPPGPTRTFPYTVSWTLNFVPPLVAADAPTANIAAATATATPSPIDCNPNLTRRSFRLDSYRHRRYTGTEGVGCTAPLTGRRRPLHETTSGSASVVASSQAPARERVGHCRWLVSAGDRDLCPVAGRSGCVDGT